MKETRGESSSIILIVIITATVAMLSMKSLLLSISSSARLEKKIKNYLSLKTWNKSNPPFTKKNHSAIKNFKNNSHHLNQKMYCATKLTIPVSLQSTAFLHWQQIGCACVILNDYAASCKRGLQLLYDVWGEEERARRKNGYVNVYAIEATLCNNEPYWLWRPLKYCTTFNP